MAESSNNEHPLLLRVEDYEEQTGFTFQDYIEHLKAQTVGIPEKSSRKHINRATKAIIWDKTNGFCYYCGCSLNPFDNFQIDHYIPLSQGGADSIDNYVPSCRSCNLSKGYSMP